MTWKEKRDWLLLLILFAAILTVAAVTVAVML